ncbi:MAG: phosphoribosylformylglycinamidine synthase II, partial [Alphaproteobacteria bacterium]|nr:phosphoribosylformylglycinamidine synthase II [Alphaproteobacteria bacterium]
NLNFGNPEKPEIMRQIVDSIAGIGEACRALAFPVVSGNCSLYNETNGEGILPTPAIGAVGLIEDVGRAAGSLFRRADDTILLVGNRGSHLGQSIYLREIEGREEGPPPPVDLAAERRNGDFVRALIVEGMVDTVHDVSDGGILVAIAEMAMPRGIGASLRAEGSLISWCFGEDQARYVLAAGEAVAANIVDRARKADIPVAAIGTTGGSHVRIEGAGQIEVAVLKQAHESWFADYMSADPIPPTH